MDHWGAFHRPLKHLKGKIDYWLHFNKFSDILEGYCDANWLTDNDHRSVQPMNIYLYSEVEQYHGSVQNRHA